ncbi:HEAT repeat domain-containing protein [Winogradskyella vincentii]|uniref:HEAT repeat domain-containing protein n=1 Tax=Winogradskyella vincentii TaxID=2877122 RepID=A0ABS7XXF1_9FLAO|nr:HEAT repeat domain-containing protein [Winogradskyella vincentii]MCA0151695.1 HEAT repeat domain-containing protein [Winogradskyella vincentii]
MFRPISFLLIKLKWLKPNQNTINRWKYNNESEKLRFILQHGNYKTRPLAATALAEINDRSSIPLLLLAIHDNIHHVSIAALNALEILDVDMETSKIINRKRFHWVKLFNDKKNKSPKPKKKSNIYRWERASKKSFDLVKERLNRPIR